MFVFTFDLLCDIMMVTFKKLGEPNEKYFKNDFNLHYCHLDDNDISLTAFAQEEILTSSNSFPPSDQYVEFIPQPPMITMLKENGGLLFTTLLIGIALGIGGTLLVQHIRRKKKQ